MNDSLVQDEVFSNIEYFKNPPLLRKEFYSTKIAEDIDQEINLLIIGGSQGAKLFDTAIRESIIDLSKKYKLKIFHQTGLSNYNNLLHKQDHYSNHKYQCPKLHYYSIQILTL